MMLSSRIHRNYTMDRENTVVININDPAAYDGHDLLGDTDLGEEEPELSPEEQAAQIIEAAQAEAEQIITDAKAAGIAEQADLRRAAKSEIAIMLEQTKEQGYQEGITQAAREGDDIRAQARQVLADAEESRLQMQQKLEPEMVDLLIGIVNKLIGNIVTLNPNTILALVRKGMQSATITGDIKIFVSPEDFDNVITQKEEISSLVDSSVNFEIVRDANLSSMDCVIETPFGNIDCSLGQQMEVLTQNISYLLNG
ncbi:MAG: FliH/SctL family protein [Defluviitaleaceae bacterium]|nr:FliH/SctL family protein [Defluviitaleaceae bacterium]MCL2275307.1 FliH/SctL family protein [Defluviitaleaceae bacterium]